VVSLVLTKVMKEAGLRAFIGKLSMDTSSRKSYVEPSAQASLDSAISFVEKFYALDEARGPRLIEPILTPRFAPTCSDSLLHGLGELAAQGRNFVPLRIQSHLAESEDQVAWVKSTRHADDIDVFDKVRSLVRVKSHPSPVLGSHVTKWDSGRPLPALKCVFFVDRDL